MESIRVSDCHLSAFFFHNAVLNVHAGPLGVWADSAGGLYVTELRGSYSLVKYTSANTDFQQAGVIVAGRVGFGSGDDGGSATSAGFTAIYGIWGDSASNLYVSDLSLNNVRKLLFSGVQTPTVQTTAVPSISVVPTVAPTRLPTAVPTTTRPTASPSTRKPTFTPTRRPSAVPTFQPTAIPTMTPTAAPTYSTTITFNISQVQSTC